MIRPETSHSENTAEVVSKNICTGIDCESISRIEGLIHKKTSTKRLFTKDEAAWCRSRHNPAKHLAGCFAAKEACMKALGTGLTGGLSWQDIEVVNKSKGRTALILKGKAREMVGKDKDIFLSLSYGAGLAVAFVAIG